MRPISPNHETSIPSKSRSLVVRTRSHPLSRRSSVQPSAWRHLSRYRRRSPRLTFRGRVLRTLTCHAIILNLLFWPSPKVTLAAITFPVTEAVSAIASTVAGLSSIVRSLWSAPVIVIPSAPIMIPFPVVPIWPFNVQASRPISMAERTARVATISLAPHRLVGYVGETVTFVAMGSDIRGDLVHGAKSQWDSSDTNKLTIDEAGRATMLHPGMVIVTSRAGAAAQAAPVLIRPIRRPVQTDQQWRADQESLVSSTGDGENGSGVLATMIDHLMPTAHAQFNSWGDNPNAAGQIGTPPFIALEQTRLGPVMPGTNFELPIPIVNLGGRGLATSLTLYYNSSVWGSYFDPVGNTNVYAFDPIQSWPSPGFSLGFGRITYTNTGSGYRYMLIDPNGTRHDLGIGSDTGTKIDIFGGVTKAQVSCCNVKSFTKTEATYWTAPSQTTSGDSSGVHLTSSAVYDFNTLTTSSQTDPDNQTTSYSYDAAQRPSGFTGPTGASGTIVYNAFGEKTSSTFSYTEGGVNKNVSSSAVYDGWSQMTSSVDANGAQTNYSYDNMGHRMTQTNPFPQGGTPGPSTSFQYDELSRLKVTTLPGGNTI